MRSTTDTLVAAMRILARDIHSGDCVASADISEAADRLEEQQARIAEIESLVVRLADMMRRGDMKEFTSEVKPVTSAEWFGALREAEALLSELDQSEHPLGMVGDHLRDATKMVPVSREALEAQRRKLSSITDQIAALYLIADAVAVALDDARDALDEVSNGR